ncbi:hypothetical protein FB567DRAFT_51287 [Paraphoma chrysanthemicola]|uniref:Secreted protein n=1 Tax=Paraphoma chrysanthemicola TaxID=798071 RepID=A0A8K0VXT5_9PLEO|nr:hypothetical protein FB567DRAFT_51287 [Paraphoma chrysanthemicola]
MTSCVAAQWWLLSTAYAFLCHPCHDDSACTGCTCAHCMSLCLTGTEPSKTKHNAGVLLRCNVAVSSLSTFCAPESPSSSNSEVIEDVSMSWVSMYESFLLLLHLFETIILRLSSSKAPTGPSPQLAY